MMSPDYDRCVFLNCPFDQDFDPLMRAAMFTVSNLGFHLLTSRDSADGGQVRIEKLYDFIARSRLAIHDLSRTEADSGSGLPRFNMPLELGIFLGAKRYGGDEQRRKECLITTAKRFDYQKYISDVAGQDIESHNNDPHQFVSVIRDWLVNHATGELPTASRIWERYTRFQQELPTRCQQAKQDAHELTYRDLLKHIDAFCASGAYELNLRGKVTLSNPTRADINRAIRSLKGGIDEYAILSNGGSSLSYIQAAGGPGGLKLEYQVGSVDEHFTCGNSLVTKDDVIQAFWWYVEDDPRWRELAWKPMDLSYL